MQTLNPALRYVDTICLLCSYVYCGIAHTALYKLFMSYIEEDKMGGMAVNIFISATTGLLEGGTPMTQLPLSHSITTRTLIDSQRVSFMLRHAYN